LRTIVYPFEDLRAFEDTLVAGEQELEVPRGETVAEGEWVLAMFEVGVKKRATAAAARGMDRGDGVMVLVFERRDWERLRMFASPRPLGSVQPPRPPSEIPLSIELVQSDLVQPEPYGEPSPEDDPTLVQDRASLPSLKGAPASGAAMRTSAARVLVVDDDPDIREVVGTMLESVGLTVETVESAEAALTSVSRDAFDLVVLDWNLPGMTGIDLCRQFRREARFAALPVLFLTAHSSSKDIVEAFASGADDYVVKPFRAPELGARIFGLLRRARERSPAAV